MRKNITKWHKWFAWKPIIINKNIVWFKNVWRKGYRYSFGSGMNHVGGFSYRYKRRI